MEQYPFRMVASTAVCKDQKRKPVNRAEVTGIVTDRRKMQERLW